jgi:hypothetical protein
MEMEIEGVLPLLFSGYLKDGGGSRKETMAHR